MIVAPLDRYVQAATFRAFVPVVAGLTALFSLLEFVEQLSDVGQGGYGVSDAFVYVLLTTPSRMLQVAPVSMLLGCLLALGALGRNSELAALRSLGVSETRIIGAVIMLTVPIVIVLFLIAQFIVPPAQQLAQERRAATALTASDSDSGFWAQDNQRYLNVGKFEAANLAKNIDIYVFGKDGTLDSFIHADRADIESDDVWRLIGVTIKRVVASRLESEHLSCLSWESFLSRRQIKLLMLPVESMPPIGLYRYVRELGLRHQQAIRYEQELWRRISVPFSMIAMIMIAAPFVFGSPRGQSVGRQIMIGMMIGIVFSLGQQIAGRLDLLLDLDPAATTLAPSLLLMGLAVCLFNRAHR